jgi:hypothetical protein
MAEEVRDCAASKVAKEAHGTKDPMPFNPSSIAESEEVISVIQNVIGNEHIVVPVNGPDVQHENIIILDFRCQAANAADNVRPKRGSERALLPKVVREFSFPYECPDPALRESEIPGETGGCIGGLGLEMVTPTEVSSDLEVMSNVTSTPNAQHLIVFELADSVVVARPIVRRIRVDFGGLRKQRRGCVHNAE